MAVRGVTRALPVLLAAAVVAGALQMGERSDSPPRVRIELRGQRQVVFDWSRQACAPTQAADLPARAFRDARGRVQLLLSHFVSFRMVGPSLSRLRVDCRPVMGSVGDPDPAAYRDRQWLAAPFTEDGRRVWALVHDEYQGNLHPGRCHREGYGPCAYHAVTLAVSDDGGRRFHPANHSARVVAAPPYRYPGGAGPVGFFAPTNVVRRGDGHLYALVRFRDPDGRRGVCLIRAHEIASQGGWRAWDGDGFRRLFNPYRRPPQPHTGCQRIAPAQIGQMAESLSFNRALGLYVLLGMGADRTSGRPRRTGVYLSVSADLVNWSERRLLMPASTVQTYRCGQRSPVAYPAVLDADSGSRIFSTSDRFAFLYFTQLHYRNCRRTPDRDLVRVPIEVRAR